MKDLDEFKIQEYTSNKSDEFLTAIDNTIYHYIHKMCKKGCKFYQGRCSKKRNVIECARKGLKNKESDIGYEKK